MKNLFPSLVSIAVLIFISSCTTSYRVVSDYESEVDFSTYQSYDIINHQHGFPVGANRINQQRIERALEKEIGQQGFIKDESPDLELFWFVKTETVYEQNLYHDYYNQWFYHQFHQVYNYKKGTLVVDLIDHKTQKVVWHGKTSSVIYEDMPNIEKKINEAAKAIMKQFAKDTKRSNTYVINSTK